MAVLLDTNILLRSTNPGDPQFVAANRAIRKFSLDREEITVATQT